MMLRFGALVSALVVVGVHGQGEVENHDPTDPCTVCYDKSEPISSDENTTPIPTNKRTCNMVISEVAAAQTTQGDSQCQNWQLEAYQMRCCPYPPYNYCSVCPDGSAYDEQTIIPIGNDPSSCDFSCEASTVVSVNYDGFFSVGDCAETWLQRSAHHCGCAGQEQECSICPDGSEVGNPHRYDPFVTFARCRRIEYIYSLYKTSECEDMRTGFGVDFATFCRCPDYEREVQDDDHTCEVCPGGSASNPDDIWTDEGEQDVTCAQAEDYAKSIFKESQCDKLMEKPRETCKCPAPGLSVALSMIMAGALILKGLLF